MESWITWIIQVVAYGIICFLLKRELNQFIQEAPFKYTLRDDFIRAVAGFDAKLDKILDQLTKRN